LTDLEERERRRLLHRWPRAALVAGLRTVLHGSSRYFIWSFAVWAMTILLVALPIAAVLSAKNVSSSCRQPLVLGFDAGRAVQLLDADTSVPQFPDRELLLLGGDSSKYVLYDCRSGSALRVPTSNYVVVNR
jgi:uncharacterized membrane protein YccC